MKRHSTGIFAGMILGLLLALSPSLLPAQFMSAPGVISAYSVPAGDLIQPSQLNDMLRLPQHKSLLIFHVGSRMMFAQAHIPHSEYIGPGSQPMGIEALRKRASSVDKKQLIVLYCGCCPWDRCPNVGPAYQTLRGMGYNVKVLQIPSNFGADWVAKGYPVERDQ
ncbi:rhodanese-like domain-containing protein [Telmatobacter bradus]|uniref:rhodanese-like domain-containing protein n=1 Tax=Telmatobacter bradus TaxID=474953 RepID=UPI003B43C6F2